MPDIAPKADPKVEREHRRLQHLIKKLAKQSGYLAIIEQPTNDGQGRVDVGLEQDKKKIACEICVTTSPEHELQNIKKCLASKYDTVILCSPDRKSLEKVKTLCKKELTESEIQKVLFLEPGALVQFFEEEAAKNAGKTGKVGRGRDQSCLLAPRTDPGVQYYCTGLLPQVVTPRRLSG